MTVVSCYHSDSTPGRVGKVLYQMLVVQALRADRLLAMAGRFVAIVLGDSFQHDAEQELDLASIVSKEVSRMCVLWWRFFFVIY